MARPAVATFPPRTDTSRVRVTEYRARFDAVVRFSDGDDLVVHGFRMNVPYRRIGETEIAALFVSSLGLVMTESVELRNVEVSAEPSQGMRSGPPEHGDGRSAQRGQLVELGHVIRPGMITYPGLPAPKITPYLTREASRARYARDTEFAIDQLTMVGNTGTYLDAPYHRYADGADVAAIPLARTADLPTRVVRVTATQPSGIGVSALATTDICGNAVLLHTGHDARFGTPEYAKGAHFLTRAGAGWLAEHGAALVGIERGQHR